ncbi:MAG: methyltransferase domain-containing protein [Brumimicrobium sp.]|nr:methyltransferase domain-containing protein [Brumimicrobium sp.]MCO5268450.1 TPMT family class I SAM-dependent methyltransferase [Brumimicrobium sp.]
MEEERILDKEFWNKRYEMNHIGWDIGYPSTPIKTYIDQLTNKNIDILIPGAGNAHEAHYLLEQGFKSITILDIAPLVVEKNKELFKNNPEVKVIEGDFWEFEGQFDLIFEQTFFCTLPLSFRPKYFKKIAELLKEKGRLCGVLFNVHFESGPPFGGDIEEYRAMIPLQLFNIDKLEECYNSIKPRSGNEVWLNLQKV